MKNILIIMLISTMVGCTTISQRQSNDVRIRSDIDNSKLATERLQEQVNGLTIALDNLDTRVVDLTSSTDQNITDIRATIVEMQHMLKNLSDAQDKDKKEIIDHLSKKISDILNSQQQSEKTENGWEHIVKTGETLSQIASAYNVKIDTIVRANNMKDANSIRVGQKLFIPE